jgi:hypothetical protein
MQNISIPPASEFITIENLLAPGPYNLFIKKSSIELRTEGFSVNIPSEEKDLRTVDPEALKQYIGIVPKEKEKESDA